MLLTAHSGSDGTPENSLKFVEYMLEHNVKGIEVDVRSDPNGKLYLSHDPLTNWSEADQVFGLEDLFRYIVTHQKTDVIVNCDLKEKDIDIKVKWLAEKWGLEKQIVYSGKVMPSHFSPWDRSLIYYNIDNCLPHIYSVNRLKKAHFDVIQYFCKKYGVNIINLNYAFCTDEWISWCEEAGLNLSVWTVNDCQKINEFKQKGIHNVTTRATLHYLKTAVTN